jgi:hypothetical protein
MYEIIYGDLICSGSARWAFLWPIMKLSGRLVEVRGVALIGEF